MCTSAHYIHTNVYYKHTNVYYKHTNVYYKHINVYSNYINVYCNHTNVFYKRINVYYKHPAPASKIYGTQHKLALEATTPARHASELDLVLRAPHSCHPFLLPEPRPRIKNIWHTHHKVDLEATTPERHAPEVDFVLRMPLSKGAEGGSLSEMGFRRGNLRSKMIRKRKHYVFLMFFFQFSFVSRVFHNL